KELDLSADEVEQIRRSSQVPVSLEKPVGDEEESEFGHFITDESAPLPDEAAEMTLRRETLERILHKLSMRERQVLVLRYGLDGQHPRTLDEVGRTFNVTRERIRQIENQTDALARDVEGPPHLVERPRMLPVEAVAEHEHLPLAHRELVKDPLQRLAAKRHLGGLVRKRCALVGDEVAELGFLLVSHRLLERHRHLRAPPDLLHLV